MLLIVVKHQIILSFYLQHCGWLTSLWSRFLVKDSSLWTRITIQPSEGDPDMYIVNSREGLVAATKDNYVWRSVSVGCGCVDIHPSDRNAARGGYFVVGVFGNRENNEFQLTVTTAAAPPIVDISKNNRFDFNLTSQYSYFRMSVNPADPESISLMAALADNVHFKAGLAQDSLSDPVDRSIGRGVYCNSSIAALSADRGPAAALIRATPLPVLYLSTSCVYPSEDFHSWKVCLAHML